MPSTATITAFYNFTANTKARASQVQGNFDVFRGHLLPVSPSTATAIDNTYDLGSSEYRFRTGYFGSLAMNTTTAQLDFLSAGSTIGSISQTRAFFPKNTLFSATIASNNLTSSSFSLMATLSMTSYGGNINVIIAGAANSSFTTGLQIQVLTSTASNPRVFLEFYRDSTATVLWQTWYGGIAKATSTAAAINTEIPANISFIDNSCTSGAHTYLLYARQNASGSEMSVTFGNGMRFQVLEVK